MTARVLVAYGSKNGSTAGIAEMVATTLRSEGFEVDVKDARGVRDVSEYAAVVLGGALYAGRWHKDARRFAHRHVRALAGRPVWLFSSGPLDDSADHAEIAAVAQVRDAAQRLAARGHATFGGRLTADAKGFIARAMVRNGHGGDFRNPDRIATWTRQLAATLRSQSPATRSRS